MWALWRAANPLRNNGFAIAISRVCYANLEVPISLEGKGGISKYPQAVSDRYRPSDVPSKLFLGGRSISTEAQRYRAERDAYRAEIIANRCKTVFEVVKNTRKVSVYKVLDRWFAQRKNLEPKQIVKAICEFYKRGMHCKANKLGDWALANKNIKVNRQLMKVHVRWVSKKYGLREAKNPLEKRKRILNGLVKIGAFARYPDKNSKVNNIQVLPTKKQSLTYLAMQYVLSKRNKTKFNPVEVVNQLVARDVSGR